MNIPSVDHKKQTIVTTARKMIFFQNLVAMAARAKGKIQYPIKQTLWKKDIVPPNRTLLRVTNTPPSHGKTKAVANTTDLACVVVK